MIENINRRLKSSEEKFIKDVFEDRNIFLFVYECFILFNLPNIFHQYDALYLFILLLICFLLFLLNLVNPLT